MTEYIVPGNIDDRILSRTVKILEGGGVAALPTDTSWSIVCSMKSWDGIKKLRRLSGRRDEEHFTLLCSDISQFGELCHFDNTRFRLIKRLTPGPYVFVLKTLLGTGKILGLRRQEIGIRLPDYPVPISLIGALGCPLYSVTAKKDMEKYSEYEEESLFEGGWELEAINDLDLILDTGESRNRIFSTVLDMREGEVELIRQGAGEWPV
ncbi:MAG: L-threonylcarbamoyladenylate synthase [Treponema sp.]|jgi:tRNA threonylcarbamoyl adenosine modification protein (Sua5/YciO/YrdC/YwlC family)|nr:L-threonylcarbamoyladenylate synthase [Treponema sp.]